MIPTVAQIAEGGERDARLLDTLCHQFWQLDECVKSGIENDTTAWVTRGWC